MGKKKKQVKGLGEFAAGWLGIGGRPADRRVSQSSAVCLRE